MLSQKKSSVRTQQMYAVIEKYLNSDVPQKVFCQAENIAHSTFTYWLQKYRNKKKKEIQPADFIPLKINPEAEQDSAGWCKIEFPNGIVIRIGG